MSHDKDSTRQTLIVAGVLCLVCSIVVSGAAVLLKPAQEANVALDRKQNILKAAGLMDPTADVNALFAKVEARVVDLASGDFVELADAEAYDQRAAAKNPASNLEIPAKQDIAGIKRRAKQASVYLVRDDQGALDTIVLPVHGYGLWSTMYGFLALEEDGNTVVGFNFYEQGETPGLGGEVDNPNWQAQWRGKKIFGDDGAPRIELVKGGVDLAAADSVYEVDALSGASLTSRGVTNLLQYWLGEQGFASFLTKIREG